MPKSKDDKTKFLSCLDKQDITGAFKLLEANLELTDSFNENPDKLNTLDKSTKMSVLEMACKNGNLDICQKLLEIGKSSGLKNLESCLLAALEEGKTKIAKELVANGAQLNYISAAGIGDIDALAEFFDGSQNLRIENDKLVEFGTMEMTKTLVKPMAVACKNGQLESCFYLIRKGADVNMYILADEEEDLMEASGLHWAAKYGHYELVKFLINYGAKIYSKDTKNDLTPAQWALEEGHEQIHKYISYLQKV